MPKERYFLVHTGLSGYLPDNTYPVSGTPTQAKKTWVAEVKALRADLEEAHRTPARIHWYDIPLVRAMRKKTEKQWAYAVIEFPEGAHIQERYIELHEVDRATYISWSEEELPIISALDDAQNRRDEDASAH